MNEARVIVEAPVPVSPAARLRTAKKKPAYDRTDRAFGCISSQCARRARWYCAAGEASDTALAENAYAGVDYLSDVVVNAVIPGFGLSSQQMLGFAVFCRSTVSPRGR